MHVLNFDEKTTPMLSTTWLPVQNGKTHERTKVEDERTFYVYELDWAKARSLAKSKVPVDDGETIEAIAP